MMHDPMQIRERGLKAITLRRLPPEVIREIRRRAEEGGKSLARTVTEMLGEACGAGPRARKPPVHRDLDDLFGAWSKARARAFRADLARLRRVDAELWR